MGKRTDVRNISLLVALSSTWCVALGRACLSVCLSACSFPRKSVRVRAAIKVDEFCSLISYSFHPSFSRRPSLTLLFAILRDSKLHPNLGLEWFTARCELRFRSAKGLQARPNPLKVPLNRRQKHAPYQERSRSEADFG